tara:strand:+ start:11276 stop:11791 length:516 start_codon:yes stop_codon:yes gene_type:complete
MLLCSIGVSALAATVHRWVDEHGVTHFSDAPPAGTVSDVTTLELSDDFPDASDTRTNYYSIANQWERLRVEREQKTRIELEKARLRAEQAAAVAYSEPAAEPQERRYYPLYFPPAANRGRAYQRPYRDFDHNRGNGHGRAGERRRIDGKPGRGESRTGGRVTTAREPMRLR